MGEEMCLGPNKYGLAIKTLRVDPQLHKKPINEHAKYKSRFSQCQVA